MSKTIRITGNYPTKEMQEKNKLIADFMGLNITKKDIVTLNYHRSWNQLMPVVEKVESIFSSHHGHFGLHIYSNGCIIQGTHFRSDIIPNPPIYFSDVTLETKIKATHQCIVYFIPWYSIHCMKCGDMVHGCLCSHDN